MTIKHQEIRVKGRRVKHPNESKYVGRACMETLQSFTQIMECLEESEVDQLLEGTLVYDEESTVELFDEIKEGDIIGCVLHEKNQGWVPTQWKVSEIPEGEDMLKCVTRYKPERERDIYFEDISIGLVMGLAEILIRDDKPFGVSEEIEYVVHVPLIEKEDEDEEDQTETADNTVNESSGTTAEANMDSASNTKAREIPILRS